MSQVHLLLGSVIVVAFLLLTILYVLRITGRAVPGVSTFSKIAAGLLLLQYVLGFLLMGGGYHNSNLHYLIALLAIIPVGLEHAWAANRTTAHQRAVGSAIAAALTTILVVAAHSIGSANAGAMAVTAYIVSLF